MQKYFCSEWSFDTVFFMPEEESRHCISVMRNQVGEKIAILDGKGHMIICEICIAHPKKTGLKALKIEKEIIENHPLHIAISPTKSNDRIEFFIEKACEIGVGQITPVIYDRTERSKINIERWIKLVQAACKQSGQLFFPKINPPISFDKFIDNISSENTVITIIGATSTIKREDKIDTIIIGPEGDFSPIEIEKVRNRNIKEICLGNAVLRVETAGIVAVSQWNFLNNN